MWSFGEADASTHKPYPGLTGVVIMAQGGVARGGRDAGVQISMPTLSAHLCWQATTTSSCRYLSTSAFGVAASRRHLMRDPDDEILFQASLRMIRAQMQKRRDVAGASSVMVDQALIKFEEVTKPIRRVRMDRTL
ncbi:hypothetical protein PF005_g14779 [Phytophthora fragariae]|uniref:Uncharacterized protein n=1 Tax=Phytophthora fragariae TaxID=53985 RepID=A0A6A3XFT7_9STRA|nr:hypothetical protein PF005_g14779 [Phytophthora fragariae]